MFVSGTSADGDRQSFVLDLAARERHTLPDNTSAVWTKPGRSVGL